MSQPDPSVTVVVPLVDTTTQQAGLTATLGALDSLGASATGPDDRSGGRIEVVLTSTAGLPPAVRRTLPAGARTVQGSPGMLLAVGAAAARSSWCVVLEPGQVPTPDTLADWARGRGEDLVPTTTLRSQGGSDTTAGVLLRGLAPRLDVRAPRSPVGNGPGSADAYATTVGPRLDAVAELEAVPTPYADAAAAVREAVATELADVRAHLDACPQDHGRLVEDVEGRGLRLVDWSVLNAGRARELALLYCFTPWNGTSGMVAARRIRARRSLVTVVTQAMDNLRGRDEASPAIAAPYVDGQHVVPGDASFATWRGITRFVRAATEVVEHGPLAGRQFDSLYSRAMFPASHVAAARHKLRHPHVRWRAELSDPLSRDIHGRPRPAQLRDGALLAELGAGLGSAGFAVPPHRDLFPWVEHLTYALADEVVFTNANQRDYMLGYCPDPDLAERAAARSTVSHHPTLPSPFYDREPSAYELEPDRVHIGYFGVFYATRGLTEVTEALAGLPGAVRARVRLHVFTSDPGPIAEEVRTAGLADVVAVDGYRPFLEFLHLTTRFDVLLVNDADHDGINPYLPSKLSDYLGSGTPIWAISQPGSVLSRQDLAYGSSLHDVAGAAEVLGRIAGTWST